LAYGRAFRPRPVCLSMYARDRLASKLFCSGGRRSTASRTSGTAAAGSFSL
jgi:hypothetical protein